MTDEAWAAVDTARMIQPTLTEVANNIAFK
jgi:hypothetical protein